MILCYVIAWNIIVHLYKKFILFCGLSELALALGASDMMRLVFWCWLRGELSTGILLSGRDEVIWHTAEVVAARLVHE